MTDPQRAAWRSLYRSTRWEGLRKRVMRRDGYTCQMCGAMIRGGRSDGAGSILRPAVVDHIIPHRGDAALFHDPANLWLVCCDCHDGPCQSIEARNLSGQNTRAAKLSHRRPSIDGTSRIPASRWVDQQYPQARLSIW